MQQRQAFTAEQLLAAAKKGISFPTITPLFKSPPNQAAIAAWVERLRKVHPLMGKVAEILGKNIDYIPYEAFYDQLQQTIAAFQQQSPDEPYVLWIPQDRKDILLGGCSDQWTAGLALEKVGLRFPTAILTTNELAPYMVAHPEIKTVLAIDDASYSGKHISEQLSALIKWFYSYELSKEDITDEVKAALHIYMAIPFQTARATARIHEVTQNQLTITLLPHRPIAVVKDYLDAELLAFLKACHAPLSQELSLTYFDHCMPDYMSTVQFMSDSQQALAHKGYLAATSELMWLMGYWNQRLRPYADLSAYRNDVREVHDHVEWNKLYDDIPTAPERLVPLIVRPYRLHTENHYNKLKAGLAANEMGEYRNNRIPERYIEAKEILQAAKGYSPRLFQPATASEGMAPQQSATLGNK